MQPQSKFLIPQKPIDNPLAQIGNLPIIFIQKKLFLKENEKEIDQKYFDLLEKLLKTVDPKEKTYSQSLLPDDSAYDGYKWNQDGSKIVVQYSPHEQISESDIIIDNESIKSPFLSGNFFDKIENPVIEFSKENVIISFNVSKPFPILIKSGDMDKYSLFFLAAFAIKMGESEISEKLMIKSAFKHNVMAMTSLAVNYLEKEKKDKTVFWFFEFAQATNEPFPYLSIAEKLMEMNPELYAHLVENILIVISDKLPTAYTNLAMLHLDSIPHFNSSKELAVEYLMYACNNFNNNNALRILGHLYITGKGVQKDTELGIKLLLKSGYNLEQIEKTLQNLGVGEVEEHEAHESFIDKFADFSIATAVVTSFAAAALFVFHRFRK